MSYDLTKLDEQKNMGLRIQEYQNKGFNLTSYTDKKKTGCKAEAVLTRVVGGFQESVILKNNQSVKQKTRPVKIDPVTNQPKKPWGWR